MLSTYSYPGSSLGFLRSCRHSSEQLGLSAEDAYLVFAGSAYLRRAGLRRVRRGRR